MGIQVICGNSLEVLKTLPENSVQCVVTSPPYWALRNYGTEGQLWGGDKDCQHEFELIDPRRGRTLEDVKSSGKSIIQPSNVGSCHELPKTNLCKKCGGWVGELGLEPYYQMYVDHLSMIFDEVYRVLRKDGTLWLNIGDSYSASGKCGGRNNGNTKRLHKNLNAVCNKDVLNVDIYGPSTLRQTLSPKNLCGIPWRVAFVLQDKGWILRSDIIWQKPSPVPESVTDRCTRSKEYVFMLTKSKKYYFNYEAVLQPYAKVTLGRYKYSRNCRHDDSNMMASTGIGFHHNGPTKVFNPKGKRLRDVWKIANPGIKEAHFATMPKQLIERCLMAGCPEGGVVMDPFGGSGQVALVADKLHMSAISIDVSEKYCEFQRNRIAKQRKEILEKEHDEMKHADTSEVIKYEIN
jgi:DNA modification methylase